MNPLGLILIAGGVFSVLGAALDWDFFMESRKARLFVGMLGRNGARVFYGILGTGIAVFGTLGVMGVVDLSSR